MLRAMCIAVLMFATVALPGCAMVEVGVANPVLGLSRVAVAPFFNLSQEPVVDGRRFAMAYFTELQKTPGFQVIPVGVVEQALFDHKLQLDRPEDALKLAEILNVDAVVVGAVTDYSPYYPPRIGLQVSWYSPKSWNFFPGPPTQSFGREWAAPKKKRKLFRLGGDSSAPEDCEPVVRGQNEDSDREDLPAEPVWRRFLWPEWAFRDARRNNDDGERALDSAAPSAVPLPPDEAEIRYDELPEPTTQVAQAPSNPVPAPRIMAPPTDLAPMMDSAPIEIPAPNLVTTPSYLAAAVPQERIDPTEPLMSYTRMFDGADARLTARLRDYVELSGDLRSGGWESHMYRSEDFIRFTAHVMIVEMLQLHGGEARRRLVIAPRKHK